MENIAFTIGITISKIITIWLFIWIIIKCRSKSKPKPKPIPKPKLEEKPENETNFLLMVIIGILCPPIGIFLLIVNMSK